MRSDVLRRFRYHAWAMARLADALPDADAEAACRPLAHALAADRVWRLRLRGESTAGVAIWPDLDAAACRALARENADAIHQYLERLDDVEAPIAYANSTGTEYTTSIADILDHVLLHAAHHRGQVSAALRAAGHAPPPVDFIAWVRMGEPRADD